MIAIVAHGDLDGLTSAAILYNVLTRAKRGEIVRLKLTQPFRLYEELDGLRYEEELGEIYIVDVGLDEATWERTRENLAELAKKSRITWIDHHIATIRHFLELSELGVTMLLSVDGCASTVVGTGLLHLTDNPSFFERLKMLGEAGDKVREIPETDPLYQVAEALGSAIAAKPTDDEFKIRLVKMWAKEHRLLDDEVAIRAEEAVKRLHELLGEANDRIIYSSDKIVVVDFRHTRVHGYAGKIAAAMSSRTKKVAFILFNVGVYETIVTCRVPPNRRFNAAKTLPEIAKKYGGGGGGHERAASIRVPNEMAEMALKEIVKLDKIVK